MKTLFKKVALSAALGASALVAAAPAQAQWRGGYGYRHYRYHDNDAGLAIGAGVLGLAVGAAIASDHRGGYYNDGYYDRGYGYDGYYGYNRPYYRYRERCWTDRVYDDYRGRWVRIERCR
ncbi:MAG: hypothetical protein H0X36_05160 [Sphingomonadaceae bacterium]|nr:hypothetical protein [Sphingomonadaceae bacterium]